MASTAEAVERHLQTDVALVDALARGVANLRRTARWLVAEYGWDTSEEAVVSALRRYVEAHPTPPLSRDRVLLRQTRVDLMTGVALITLPRTYEIHGEVRRVWSAVEPLDTVCVVPARKRIRVLVDSANLEAVIGAMPPGSVRDVRSPISALRLTLPDDAKAVSLLGHAVAALVHRGTAVLDVITCLPECLILVPEETTMEAYQTVAVLTGQPDVAES